MDDTAVVLDAEQLNLKLSASASFQTGFRCFRCVYLLHVYVLEATTRRTLICSTTFFFFSCYSCAIWFVFIFMGTILRCTRYTGSSSHGLRGLPTAHRQRHIMLWKFRRLRAPTPSTAFSDVSNSRWCLLCLFSMLWPNCTPTRADDDRVAHIVSRQHMDVVCAADVTQLFSSMVRLCVCFILAYSKLQQ